MKKSLLLLFLIIAALFSEMSCIAEDFDCYDFINIINGSEEKYTVGGSRYALALNYLYNGKYKEALRLTEELIKEYPYIPEGYLILADIKSKTGHTDEIEEIYNECKKNEPLDVRAYMHTALIYHNQKKYKEAIKEYDKILEIVNNNRTGAGFYTYVFYFNRAVEKYFDGDSEGALNDYHLAKIHSEGKLNKNAVFFFNRGMCRFDTGDIDGAKADYQKAVKLNPKAGYVYYEKRIRN